MNLRGRLIVVHKPLIMGILNITPDSFFEGSRVMENEGLISRAGAMVHEGADILDIGGQSTRPGSKMLNSAEEAVRVVPAIEAVSKHFPETIISVDTFYADVAKSAVEAGAQIVNDISAGTLDNNMLGMVASLKVPYIFMHMRGTPSTMNLLSQYENVVDEIWEYLAFRLYECKKAGIHDVICDPGFGFAKTIDQNFQLLSKFEQFGWLDIPVMAGLSRKSTIYKTLGITPEEALNGTSVCNTIALQKKAAILRVHDVREAKQIAKLLERV